ncbi:MAG: hypothetical protein ABSG53_08910 [Thermoguttaceae bacterium]|jgi:hypothetical protein
MVVPTAMSAVAQPPAGPIVIDVDKVVVVADVDVAAGAVDDVVPATDDRTVARAGTVANARSVTDPGAITYAWPITCSGAAVTDSRSVARPIAAYTGSINDARQRAWPITDTWPIARSWSNTADIWSIAYSRPIHGTWKCAWPIGCSGAIVADIWAIHGARKCAWPIACSGAVADIWPIANARSFSTRRGTSGDTW